MSSIIRNRIPEKISSELRRENYILAVWLEGSDGTKSVDEHSDIDLVCDAKEGFVDKAIFRLDTALNELGELDVAYEEHRRPSNNRYKVYHLADTPQSLLIDVTFQSESFAVSFSTRTRPSYP